MPDPRGQDFPGYVWTLGTLALVLIGVAVVARIAASDDLALYVLAGAVIGPLCAILLFAGGVLALSRYWRGALLVLALPVSVALSAIWAAPLVRAAAWARLVPRPESEGCEVRDVLARAVSPDGAWVATLYRDVCARGSWMSYSTKDVEITRPDAGPSVSPGRGTIVSIDDHGGELSNPVSIAWTAARTLEITLSNAAEFYEQWASYGDINITYRFVPDDPVARACLLEWRALPVEEVMRRDKTANENQDAFMQQCRERNRR